MDLGCGPGGSFPYLRESVRESGVVIGVEISPEAAINAQRRIRKHGWNNVQVITANAQDVSFNGSFDAVLMMGAPDIYGSTAVLANIGRYLRDGARFAAFGARLSRQTGAKLVNPAFRSFFAKATFSSTPELDFEPWRPLKNCSASFSVEELAHGFMFLAWGEWHRKDLHRLLECNGDFSPTELARANLDSSGSLQVCALYAGWRRSSPWMDTLADAGFWPGSDLRSCSGQVVLRLFRQGELMRVFEGPATRSFAV